MNIPYAVLYCQQVKNGISRSIFEEMVCNIIFIFFLPSPHQAWICQSQREALWSWGPCWPSAYTFYSTGNTFSNIALIYLPKTLIGAF